MEMMIWNAILTGFVGLLMYNYKTKMDEISRISILLKSACSKGLNKMAAKPGLYANINAKRKRIAEGSGEKMRKPGSKGAPTAKAFRESAKTAKKGKK